MNAPYLKAVEIIRRVLTRAGLDFDKQVAIQHDLFRSLRRMRIFRRERRRRRYRRR